MVNHGSQTPEDFIKQEIERAKRDPMFSIAVKVVALRIGKHLEQEHLDLRDYSEWSEIAAAAILKEAVAYWFETRGLLPKKESTA